MILQHAEIVAHLNKLDATMFPQRRRKRMSKRNRSSAVYHWFVRQAVTRGRVVARRPSGEEVTLETAELTALEGNGHGLSVNELGLLAEQLASASDPAEATRLKERLTRGFYGT